jgi:anthraniloyl-CoA monooxygenase
MLRIAVLGGGPAGLYFAILMKKARPQADITGRFACRDDIEIRFKGTRRRIGGNGFCGCSRRTLLLLLQDRARAQPSTIRHQRCRPAPRADSR